VLKTQICVTRPQCVNIFYILSCDVIQFCRYVATIRWKIQVLSPSSGLRTDSYTRTVLLLTLSLSLSLFLVFFMLASILCILCFCMILCIVSTFVYSCFFTIFVQVCRPLPSGENPTAENKYRIISNK